MRNLASTIKHLLLAPAFAVLALVGGCGSGVQLEGPGFEYLGITGNSNKAEKKVPDRAPLLLPPDRARLPAPRQSTASVSPQNWPNDPGDVRNAEDAEIARKQKEYEDKGDWSDTADIDEFEKLMDPLDRQKGALSRGRSLPDRFRDSKNYDVKN